MNPSIPASTFVEVIPSVLSAGAADLAMNAVFVDNSGDTSIPLGTVQEFGSYASVAAWYGSNSVQAALAGIYFAGYNGGTALPSALYFTQYNSGSVAAYLRGGSLSGVTLAQIQGLSGTISINIDGTAYTSAAINLASATSFSNAAALIQTGLQTGSPSNSHTCTYDSLRNAFVITSSVTGASSTIAFPTTSSFTTGLKFTAAAGAVLSQGAVAATPASVMNAVVAQTQDWATFMTIVDPDNGAAGGPIKVAFATWNSEQNDAYAYVAYDSDPLPATELVDSACFGAQVDALSGTIPIWSATQGASIAAFICGLTASINFTATGGRTTYAFRSSPSLTPDVTNQTTYLNLKNNGYNCYCNVATSTAAFQWFQPGQISGPWIWADTYINQIYWNAAFQNDFAELLTQVPAIPYTPAGYNMIRQAIMPDITAMGAFGAWVAGVQLSGSQTVAVNTAAGIPIAATLQSQGWYLQVKDPGASARSARQTPDVTFWYTDGGSVQQINMASVDVE